MHSGNEEGAALIKEEVSQLLPDAEIREYPINAVIACHTGLGSAGVQVIEKVEEADV
jgi:fatty acid-binding protein DegV